MEQLFPALVTLVLQILVLPALSPRVCLSGGVVCTSFLPRNWVQGQISRPGSQLGAIDATLKLQPACPLWRGCCGFSVFCRLVFAVPTGQGLRARHSAAVAAGGRCCWAHRPPAASCPSAPLAVQERALLKSCWGREREGAPLAGERGRSCPYVRAEKQARAARESTLLKQAQSAQPRGCEKESVPPSQSCPPGSAGPVSCTALPTESCSVTLARQKSSTLPFIFCSLSGQRGRRGTGSACSPCCP